MKENTKFTIKLAFYILLIIIFTIVGYQGYKAFKSDTTSYNIEYKPTGKADYKVYLKENSYFETPYLTSGNSYISSLIDYITVDFDYNIIYGEKLNGDYGYVITATILANKVNESNGNGDYWSKEYTLDSGSESFTNTNVLSLSKNVNINYQEYNTLLSEFKKSVGLSVDGILRVEMKITSYANKDELNGQINEESTIALEIPLTQSSLDINITKDENTTTKVATLNTLSQNNIGHILYFIIFISSIAINLIAIILIILEVIDYNNKRSAYEKELSKILSTYNSIIVNVDVVKNLSNYNLITVNSFDELLDAHSEVRMPINYISREKPKESIFILFNENIAWVYKLTPKGKKNENKNR